MEREEVWKGSMWVRILNRRAVRTCRVVSGQMCFDQDVFIMALSRL